MTRRKDGRPPVRITKDEARRWSLPKAHQESWTLWNVNGAKQLADMRSSTAETSDTELDPTVEELITTYQYWHSVETDAVTMKKQIAIRLMEYRFISITKLAEALGVSRPTLYAWKEEADAAAQPIPEFGRRRDAPPKT